MLNSQPATHNEFTIWSMFKMGRDLSLDVQCLIWDHSPMHKKRGSYLVFEPSQCPVQERYEKIFVSLMEDVRTSLQDLSISVHNDLFWAMEESLTGDHICVLQMQFQ